MTVTTFSPAQSAPINAAKDFLIYVNGKLVPQQDAVISVFDSGLNFADGVFEGIRVYGGRVLHLEHHIKRLYEFGERVRDLHRHDAIGID